MVDLMKEDQIRPGSHGFVPKIPLAVERASVKRTIERGYDGTKERGSDRTRGRGNDGTTSR